MTVTDLTTLITTVGFPVVMCGALFWYMVQQNTEHKEETAKMKDAINALEKAIIQLTDRLTKGE